MLLLGVGAEHARRCDEADGRHPAHRSRHDRGVSGWRGPLAYSGHCSSSGCVGYCPDCAAVSVVLESGDHVPGNCCRDSRSGGQCESVQTDCASGSGVYAVKGGVRNGVPISVGPKLPVSPGLDRPHRIKRFEFLRRQLHRASFFNLARFRTQSFLNSFDELASPLNTSHVIDKVDEGEFVV